MPPPIRDDGKVVVQFRNTGGAPILKQQKFKFPADARFSSVISMLRQHLKLPAEESLVRARAAGRACIRPSARTC